MHWLGLNLIRKKKKLLESNFFPKFQTEMKMVIKAKMIINSCSNDYTNPCLLLTFSN